MGTWPRMGTTISRSDPYYGLPRRWRRCGQWSAGRPHLAGGGGPILRESLPVGTTARDPEVSLGSTLPPGGCPAWDDEYMAWVREYVAGLNAAHRLIADRPLLNEFQLTGHLFKYLHGPGEYPKGITYAHRLRFTAIQHHYRAAELRAEADRYVEALARADADQGRLF